MRKQIRQNLDQLVGRLAYRMVRCHLKYRQTKNTLSRLSSLFAQNITLYHVGTNILNECKIITLIDNECLKFKA